MEVLFYFFISTILYNISQKEKRFSVRLIIIKLNHEKLKKMRVIESGPPAIDTDFFVCVKMYLIDYKA